jgi:hypothetical protein
MICWVRLGNWGIGIKWYHNDGILAIQIGGGQLEIELRRRW